MPHCATEEELDNYRHGGEVEVRIPSALTGHSEQNKNNLDCSSDAKNEMGVIIASTATSAQVAQGETRQATMQPTQQQPVQQQQSMLQQPTTQNAQKPENASNLSSNSKVEVSMPRGLLDLVERTRPGLLDKTRPPMTENVRMQRHLEAEIRALLSSARSKKNMTSSTNSANSNGIGISEEAKEIEARKVKDEKDAYRKRLQQQALLRQQQLSDLRSQAKVEEQQKEREAWKHAQQGNMSAAPPPLWDSDLLRETARVAELYTRRTLRLSPDSDDETEAEQEAAWQKMQENKRLTASGKGIGIGHTGAGQVGAGKTKSKASGKRSLNASPHVQPALEQAPSQRNQNWTYGKAPPFTSMDPGMDAGIYGADALPREGFPKVVKPKKQRVNSRTHTAGSVNSRSKSEYTAASHDHQAHQQQNRQQSQIFGLDSGLQQGMSPLYVW